MDTIASMRAFVAVARTGSFNRAAHQLDLVPSVVTKRIAQLERLVGHRLLHRTTRKVMLSAEGEHHLERFSATVAMHDAAIADTRKGIARLNGMVRVKVPTTLGLLRLNALIGAFVEAYPDVDVETLMRDGPMNPISERIDIAITAFPASYAGVIEEFLWPIARGIYASPRYLAEHPAPNRPRELSEHRCLAYQPTGQNWSFLGKQGVVSVTLTPRLSCNDMTALLLAAENDLGIALLSDYVAAPAVRRGTLLQLLPDFPVPDLWLRAMIPCERMSIPRVAALLAYIKASGQEEQTWRRGGGSSESAVASLPLDYQTSGRSAKSSSATGRAGAR